VIVFEAKRVITLFKRLFSDIDEGGYMVFRVSLLFSVFNASYFDLIFYALGSIIKLFMNFGNFGNEIEVGTLVFTINALFYHKAALVIAQ
jgi:hypothetical protein